MPTLPTPTVLVPPTVQGFFDESGKWKDSAGVFVFAGVVGFRPTLDKAVRQWAERLSATKLPFTSMKDALNFQGPYELLRNSTEERDAVLLDLAKIHADNSSLLRVSSTLERATQDAFNALPRQEQKSLGGNPYYGAFEACILGALAKRDDVFMQVVCDLSEEYSEKCITAFNKIRVIKPDVKRRCLGISFSDDSWCPPLQMADMLAYCDRAIALAKVGREVVNPVVQKVIDVLHTDDQELRHVLYQVNGTLGGMGTSELE